MKTRRIVLIAHNIRSCHNIGSLMRSADGLGVQHLYLTGYSPYPEAPKDTRLPHLRLKISKQIHKTALGAENSLGWSHEADVATVIAQLRQNDFSIVALEQTPDSAVLDEYKPRAKIALMVGNEIDGLDQRVLNASDTRLQIPMYGAKESFNVTVATAIGLYHLQTANLALDKHNK